MNVKILLICNISREDILILERLYQAILLITTGVFLCKIPLIGTEILIKGIVLVMNDTNHHIRIGS